MVVVVQSNITASMIILPFKSPLLASTDFHAGSFLARQGGRVAGKKGGREEGRKGGSKAERQGGRDIRVYVTFLLL